MASFLRVLVGCLLLTASALLGAYAPQASPEQRTVAWVAFGIATFIGTACLAEQLRRGGQTPGGPSRRRQRNRRPPRSPRTRSFARRGAPTARWPGHRRMRDAIRFAAAPLTDRAHALARRMRRTADRGGPRLLPPRMSAFRGRRWELRYLVEWHRRPVPANAGTRLLLISGMPSAGKSALALEFAHRIRHLFPDGQFYENLGKAGSSRSVGEILRRWLLALGWPAGEMPPDAQERARTLQSLVKERRLRILLVLDAVRDPDQVFYLDPADAGCTVIATSRRDISPEVAAEPLTLGALPVDEALELLDVYTPGLADRPADAECAARVIADCGRLPGAIWSVGNKVTEQQIHLCSAADMLRTPGVRMAWLEGANDVMGRITTEYARLDPPEQRVFRFLALLRSATFVPWAASAMLNVSRADAEDLVAELGTAQLLSLVGRDQGTGLDRYAFHPLVRLYAARKLAEVEGVDSAEVIGAQQRLAEVSLYVVGRVIEQLEPGFREPRLRDLHPSWLPAKSDFPQRIAQHPFPWIRAEWRQVLAAVGDAAHREWWPVAWRAAVLLGNSLPEALDFDPARPERGATGDLAEAINAFDIGLRAAQRDAHEVGGIKVQLAKATFLTAVERYQQVEETLDQARRAALGLAEPGLARRFEAVTRQLRGAAYLQMGDRCRAIRWLDHAHVESVDRVAGVGFAMLDLLRAEAHGFDVNGAVGRPPGNDPLIGFTESMVRAENARRLGDWRSADRQLVRALKLAQGDARRSAGAHYRMARLGLDQFGSGAPEADGSAVDAAVAHAVQALLAFQRMGNLVGDIRARCLLVRALAAAGRLRQAEIHCARAASALRRLPAESAPAERALTARLRRATGELQLARARRAGRDDLAEQGRHQLTNAARLFDELGDWRAVDECLQWRDGGGTVRDGSVNGRYHSAPGTVGPLARTVPSQRAGDGITARAFTVAVDEDR